MEGVVLRICIRPLHGAFMLLAIMDIRAHPISCSERPLEAAWVTRSRVRRRDRFSISSIQLADLGGDLLVWLEACFVASCLHQHGPGDPSQPISKERSRHAVRPAGCPRPLAPAQTV